MDRLQVTSWYKILKLCFFPDKFSRNRCIYAGRVDPEAWKVEVDLLHYTHRLAKISANLSHQVLGTSPM